MERAPTPRTPTAEGLLLNNPPFVSARFSLTFFFFVERRSSEKVSFYGPPVRTPVSGRPLKACWAVGDKTPDSKLFFSFELNPAIIQLFSSLTAFHRHYPDLLTHISNQ